MRIYLCGQKYFGAAAFAMIRGLGHEIVGVSSPAWKRERVALEHGTDEAPDRLRAAAESDGVRWLEAGRLRAETLPGGTDLIVAAHSHDFIGRATRLASKLGAIGYHPSLLPLHRGRDAVKWAVRLRDPVTGGTAYWFNDTVDGGPIAAQDWCFIRPDDTAETLWRRELQPMGLRLLRKVLLDLAAGKIVSVPQDHTLATWEPALNPPPLFRPELPQIGGVAGYRFTEDEEMSSARAEARLAMCGGKAELEAG